MIMLNIMPGGEPRLSSERNINNIYGGLNN